MTHDELRALCDCEGPLTLYERMQIRSGCLALLDEVEGLRSALKEQKDIWELGIRASNAIQESLKTTQKELLKALEFSVSRLNGADQAPQIDKHIGLIPDDWTTWIKVADLRQQKAVWDKYQGERD